MATTNQVLKARVERGAALLDAEQPGWAPRIDVPTLDVHSVLQCVLGQLYGDYGKGLGEVGGNWIGLGIAQGFFDASNRPSSRLTPLWREAIEARCGGDA